jgi:3-methylcrotonyl-CoA carboxylase alpha subunit
VVSPYYDSLLAKLIAFGPDRATATARLTSELQRDLVAGPKTNLAFLHTLLAHPAFVDGRMDTGLIGRELASLTAGAPPNPHAISYGVSHMRWRARDEIEDRRRERVWGDGLPSWNAHDGFQLGAPRSQRMTVLVDGAPLEVEVGWNAMGPVVHLPGADGPPYPAGSTPQLAGDGNRLHVLYGMHQTELRWPTYEADAIDAVGDGAAIRAPIIGRVAKVFVKAGEVVTKGDRIAVVEAMKMEHVLHALRDGVVAKVAVAVGQQVAQGALIAALAE